MSTIDARYGKFSVFGRGDLISDSLRLYGEWAGLELGLHERLIKKGSTILDVGAFIGTHARGYSEMVGSEGRVIAFEPNPSAYSKLEENIRAARIPNLTVKAIGLGARTGSMQVIGKDAANVGGTRLGKSLPSAEHIQIKRLDDEVDYPVHYIKLDVEGMERQVLEGAQEVVRKHAPLLFAECNSITQGVELLEWAKARRYRVFGAVSAAYNPDNFNGAKENIFGDSAEVSLIMIPARRVSSFRRILQNAGCAEVANADDLALILLQKPQFPYEVLRNSRAAKVFAIDYPSHRSDELEAKLAVTQEELRLVVARSRKTELKLERECAALSEGLRKAETLSIERLAQTQELDGRIKALTETSLERMAEAERLNDALRDVTMLSIQRLEAVEILARELDELRGELIEARREKDEEQRTREKGDIQIHELMADIARERSQREAAERLAIHRLEEASRQQRLREEAEKSSLERLTLFLATDAALAEAQKLSIERLRLLEQACANPASSHAEDARENSIPDDGQKPDTGDATGFRREGEQ